MIISSHVYTSEHIKIELICLLKKVKGIFFKSYIRDLVQHAASWHHLSFLQDVKLPGQASLGKIKLFLHINFGALVAKSREVAIRGYVYTWKILADACFL